MAVLMMVVLLALVALVIDGGRGYLDRRTLQSTADTAALSGAGQLSVAGRPHTDFSYARAAAINEAVSNLPNTAVPSGYSFKVNAGTGSPGVCANPLQCDISGLSLGNGYTMDVQATLQTVTATLHHTLALTFGVSAGFGPSISPSASATAENGALGFALILFRTNCDGGNDCANLVDAGSGVTLDIRAASGAPPGTTGDAMTNESICPGPGAVDFDYEGDMYAFLTTWAKFPGGSCDTKTGAVTRTASGKEQIAWSPQISNPNYPEPAVTGSCSAAYACNTDVKISTSGSVCLQPGTYSSLNVAKGTVVLAPGVFRFTDGTGKDVGVSVGSGGAVTTIDKAGSPAAAAAVCGLGSAPSDSGVAIEMTPIGSAGDKNQLNVTSGASFAISGSRTNRNISVYVENSSTGDPCFWSSGQGCGSSVVVFQAGATYNVSGVVYGYGDNMTFGGGSGGAGLGQVFAWTVKVNGNGTITETYDPAQRPVLQGLIK